MTALIVSECCMKLNNFCILYRTYSIDFTSSSSYCKSRIESPLKIINPFFHYLSLFLILSLILSKHEKMERITSHGKPLKKQMTRHSTSVCNQNFIYKCRKYYRSQYLPDKAQRELLMCQVIKIWRKVVASYKSIVQRK